MGLESFENGVERLVSGVFSRGSRLRLRPVDLGRRLLREIDEHRSVDARGRRIVPNTFNFLLCSTDINGLSEIEDQLLQELCETAREYAKSEGFHFLGPVRVSMSIDDDLRPGRVMLTSRMKEAQDSRAGGEVVLPSGDRIPVGPRPITVGRMPDCTVPIDDANASRRHCEIKLVGNTIVVADLGSTNGTRVNGVRIDGERALSDADIISVGTTHLRFEAS